MVGSTERCSEQGHMCYGSSFLSGLELHLAGLGEAAAARLLPGG